MPRESDQSLYRRAAKLKLDGLLDGPVYGWDLDSTICHTLHRQGMVGDIKEGRGVTWDDYAMRCTDDTPIAGSVALMRELQGSHIAISGRSALAEELTWEWFRRHQVPVCGLLLRKFGDHTPNGTYKVRALKALRRAGADIRLFFEDWDEVEQEIVAETGIPVVGINPFYPAAETAGKGAF